MLFMIFRFSLWPFSCLYFFAFVANGFDRVGEGFSVWCLMDWLVVVLWLVVFDRGCKSTGGLTKCGAGSVMSIAFYED